MGDINGPVPPDPRSRGLLLTDGREHLRQRKLMLPPFHGERMRAYGELMREVAEREVSSWPLHEEFALCRACSRSRST